MFKIRAFFGLVIYIFVYLVAMITYCIATRSARAVYDNCNCRVTETAPLCVYKTTVIILRGIECIIGHLCAKAIYSRGGDRSIVPTLHTYVSLVMDSIRADYMLQSLWMLFTLESFPFAITILDRSVHGLLSTN